MEILKKYHPDKTLVRTQSGDEPVCAKGTLTSPERSTALKFLGRQSTDLSGPVGVAELVDTQEVEDANPFGRFPISASLSFGLQGFGPVFPVVEGGW